MDALEAIATRRMRPRVTDERPTREEIAELLDLAVRAPNHHLTEPWRFRVLAGEGREALAGAMAAQLVESKGQSPDEALEAARKLVERAPVIVVFSVVPSDDPKVVEQEEIATVAMAIQNFLLAAHAVGIGAMLRTGAVAYHPSVARHLGFEPGEKVVGFVYVGRPAEDRAITPRKPSADSTSWVGWA